MQKVQRSLSFTRPGLASAGGKVLRCTVQFTPVYSSCPYAADTAECTCMHMYAMHNAELQLLGG